MKSVRPANTLMALMGRVDKPELCLIPITADTQDDVVIFFDDALKALFVPELEALSYTQNYRADESEVYEVKEFKLPSAFAAAFQNPLALPVLNLAEERPRALVFGNLDDGLKLAFQAMRKQQVLHKKRRLFLSNGVYQVETKDELILGDGIDAAFAQGSLRFRSFHFARMVVPLSEYYREATEEELDKLEEHKCLAIESPKWRDNADLWVRRKAAAILDSGVLDKLEVSDIEERARQFGLEIKVENERIVVPGERVGLKSLLRFLAEDVFDGPLSGKLFVTNSKRALK